MVDPSDLHPLPGPAPAVGTNGPDPGVILFPVTRSAVLLRAVNVGGRNRIAMPAFRAVLEGVGCSDVATYLQSGNAVVTSRRSPPSLEKAVAAALGSELGLSVGVLVRTAAELDQLVAANPFPDVTDPKLLHVVFLQAAAPDLADLDVAPDRLGTGDRVIYVSYATSSQDSRAAKVLGGKAFSGSTARNWRTVLALQELAQG